MYVCVWLLKLKSHLIYTRSDKDNRQKLSDILEYIVGFKKYEKFLTIITF